MPVHHIRTAVYLNCQSFQPSISLIILAQYSQCLFVFLHHVSCLCFVTLGDGVRKPEYMEQFHFPQAPAVNQWTLWFPFRGLMVLFE